MNPETSQASLKTYARQQSFWFVLVSGTLFGLVLNFIAPAFPAMRETFGATLEQLGRLQLIYFAGGTVFGLAGGWVALRFGPRRGMIIALVMVVAGMLAFGFARTLVGMQIGAALCGVGSMGILVMDGAIISRVFAARRQSVFILLGLTGAIGGSGGAAIMGRWIVYAGGNGLDWRLAALFIAGLLSLFIIWGLLLRIPVSGNSEREKEAEGLWTVTMRVIQRPEFLIATFWMFLHGLAQIGMMSWIGLIFQARHGLDAAQTAYFIALNGAGFFAGRVLLSWVTSRWRIRELSLLSISGIGSGLLFALVIVSPGYLSGLVVFSIAGMVTSGNAPSVQSWLGAVFGSRIASAFALMSGIANIGCAIGPYITGIIGTWFGLETGIWFMPGFMLMLGITALIWRLKEHRSQAIGDTRIKSSEIVPQELQELRT